MTKIEVRAFENNDLTRITIPNNIEEIRTMAFAINDLFQVEIGEDVTLDTSSIPTGFILFYNEMSKAAGFYNGSWSYTGDTVSVSFHVDGGSPVETITTTPDTMIIKPADPTKPGHTFGGWYKEVELENEWDFATEKTENMTLYAKWNTVPVQQQTGGGGSTTPSQPASQIITVPVETGNVGEGARVTETEISRTRDQSGRVNDEVTLTTERARDAIQAVIEAGQNRARIVIPDDQDEVAKVNVNIPREATRELGSANVDLSKCFRVTSNCMSSSSAYAFLRKCMNE